MTTLYGIKNCDTIRKARKWLTAHEIDYRFHDVRSDGIDCERIEKWVDAAGWETVLNRRGTTWRQLIDDEKSAVSRDNVVALLMQHPAMIKRPVLETDTTIEVGFSEARYRQIFNK